MRGRLPLGAAAMLAVGIVLGFFLGGLAPRRELAERDEEVARLERELSETERSSGWRSPVPGLDRILREPGRTDRGAPLPGPARALEGERGVEELHDEREERTEGDGGVGREGWRDRWREGESTAADRLAAFRRAASVQRVRRVQSRAALAEQAGLNDAELRDVDAALTVMNEELLGHGEELLVLAMGDEPPAARDLLGITHDVTGILHRAQLRIEQIVGPERATSVDPSALEIWNHVDLGQLEGVARSAADRIR